jgi:anti-sigma-K factor RskA
MNDRPTHEEREALIAGDRAGALEPAEADELALFADLLGDPSTWAEPDAQLEDAVVEAVTNAAPSAAAARPHRAQRPWRVALGAVAAAAVIAVMIGVVAANQETTKSQYEAALSGTPLAPDAHGSAGIVKEAAGYRVTLDARGLPLLPEGSFYQAWLKDARGTLVPIGSFSSSNGNVTLWSGVSPDDFTTFTVTIERADNDQTSSGHRVLAGPVHPR